MNEERKAGKEKIFRLENNRAKKQATNEQWKNEKKKKNTEKNAERCKLKKKKEEQTKKWKKMKIFLENQEINYISVWDDIVEYDSG